MSSDAQITGDYAVEAQLAALQAQYEALHAACMADGMIDEEEEIMLARVAEKIAAAEQALRRAQGTGFELAGFGQTTAAFADDLGAQATVPGEVPDAENMTTPPLQRSITASVGNGGRNDPEDVLTVQQLLNGKGASLSEDGRIGPATVRAIADFQQRELGFADGRIDPGGKTWDALAGGAAAAPPAGFEDDLASLIDATPEGDAPPPEVENADSPDNGEPPQGSWVDAETSIEVKKVTFKVTTDASGNVTGGGVEYQKKVKTPNVGVPPYFFGASAALFGEVSLRGPGPRVDVAFKIGGKGVGFLGVGPAAGDAVAGFKVEVELNGICDLPFEAVLDLETPTASEAFFGLPLQFSLGGAIKAGAVIEAGDFGISHIVPVAEYKEFLFLRIEDDGECIVAFGPGYHEFINDIKNLHELVIEAVEKADKNPELVGTGGMGQGLLVDEANSVGEDIHRVANEALVAALRNAEGQMRAAYLAGWEDPSLLGKANALTQQDEDRARAVYGQAWTQRALAKQSYDQYATALDTAPADIVEARMNQALGIAGKFNQAIALFRQGDAQW